MELQPFVDKLAFAESPRWRDDGDGGALWFSDFYTRRVSRARLDGSVETVFEVPGQPSGLGWLPDGRLLVVSMTDRRLMCWDGAALTEAADLSMLATGHCNDMLVDVQGRAWIGHFGFDMFGRAPFAPASLIMVPPDGTPRVAATDLHFPNGTVITPDGKTLIVAESYSARMSSFDVAADGTLHNRCIWAQLKGAVPDGICLDAEGAVWVSSPISKEVLRVLEGGVITHRIATPASAVACMLGGPDRKTLFVLTGKVLVTPQQSLAAMSGRIYTLPVDVPGAGLP